MRRWTMNRGQRGFTLIDFLLSLALAGILGTGITVSAFQVINVHALNTKNIVAVGQVESAAYWINRDVRMAQVIQPGADAGFPLHLSWVEWDGNTANGVTYEIKDGQLWRHHAVGTQPPVQTLIARYIDSDPASTSCEYVDRVFTLKVTAAVGGFRPSRETRTVQVIPRAAR